MLSLENASGGNFTLGNATLTGLSGGVATYSTSAVPFSNRGKVFTRGAIAGAAAPTVDNNGSAINLVANQATCVAWCFDASGAVKVLRGPIVPYTDTSANSTKVEFPLIPTTLTPFAYSVIKAGATTVGTWAFGTGLWNATGIVIDAVVNVATLPDTSPLTA